LAALGDSSITAPGVDRPDDAYIRRVARALTDRYFVHLQSFAVGGAKVHEVARGQLAAAVEWKPNLAVVSIGGNDAIRAVPARYYETQLDHIVSSLVAAGSLVCVVGVGDLGSIPRLPRFLSRYLTLRSAQFDKVSERVAARHPGVAKVDVRGELSKAFWELPEMFSRDQFHGSSFGHQKFAESVLTAVELLLAGSQSSAERWSEQ
jgi:lysophospholipase L1-like esterase